MTNFDEATNGSALTIVSGETTNVGSYSAVTLSALSSLTNGLSGTFTNAAGYTNYSWMNTNGYGVYELLTTTTNVTFTFGLNQWAGGGNWGSGGGTVWSAGIDPSSSNAIAYFGTLSSGSVTLDQARTVNGLILSNSAGYALSGSPTLTLAPSANIGGASINNAAGSNSIAVPILMGGNLALTGAGTLSLSGNIGDGGNGYALTNNNTGRVTLSGSNSYSGGTFINAGTLVASNANALAGGAVSVEEAP